MHTCKEREQEQLFVIYKLTDKKVKMAMGKFSPQKMAISPQKSKVKSELVYDKYAVKMIRFEKGLLLGYFVKGKQADELKIEFKEKSV